MNRTYVRLSTYRLNCNLRLISEIFEAVRKLLSQHKTQDLFAYGLFGHIFSTLLRSIGLHCL